MKTILLTIIFIYCLLIPNVLRAESGLGTDFSPWNTSQSKKEKKARPADTFIKILSVRLGQKQEELTKLWNRGYGRNELIKLILISKNSNKDLREIIKHRKNGDRISRLAEKYNLDYYGILDEANMIRKEVDFQVNNSSSSANINISISTSSATKKE